MYPAIAADGNGSPQVPSITEVRSQCNDEPAGLEGLLSPISVEEFVDKYLGRRALYVSSTEERLTSLLSWPALNRIIAYHNLEGPRLRLMRAGQVIARNTYSHHDPYGLTRTNVIDCAAFEQQLRDGSTLVLDGVDRLHKPIATLARSIERALSLGIQVNTYAGWRELPGLSLHWDRHDVLILQVYGKKRWQIYGPTRMYPLVDDVDDAPEPNGKAIWDHVVTSGDVLYIPRGWWHIAIPCDAPTLHLTVGVRIPTGSDLLMWLIQRLKHRECIRKDVPLWTDGNVQQEYVKRLLDLISECCLDGRLIEEYMRERNATARPRTHLSLPFAATDEIVPASDSARIDVLLPRRLELRKCPDGLMELLFNGKACKFRPEATGVLEWLAAVHPVSIGEFYRTWENMMGRRDLEEFLVDLKRHGLIGFDE